MTGYHLPTDTDRVTASWQDHRDRRPPSSEPGTDYARFDGQSYGKSIFAPGNGVVFETKTNNSGPTGRFITIDMDDGRRTRSLHLSQVGVRPGQRVTRGQQIGLLGGSANGSDWGVGAHVHQTLWAGHYYKFGKDGTIDFDAHVERDTPTPPAPTPISPTIPEEELDMKPGQVHYTNSNGAVVRALYVPGTAYWMPWTESGANIANGLAKQMNTGSSVQVTESMFNAMARAAALLAPRSELQVSVADATGL
jgi:murein DD-endopeptidase MepM/ murein hydrolase activator NlpD